jgi:hypothetical protein
VESHAVLEIVRRVFVQKRVADLAVADVGGDDKAVSDSSY